MLCKSDKPSIIIINSRFREKRQARTIAGSGRNIRHRHKAGRTVLCQECGKICKLANNAYLNEHFK